MGIRGLDKKSYEVIDLNTPAIGRVINDGVISCQFVRFFLFRVGFFRMVLDDEWFLRVEVQIVVRIEFS